MDKMPEISEFECSLPNLQAWAQGQMVARPPDFEIGYNYLRRWWVVPRNRYSNLYLHHFLGSDDDRAMHDHPWPWTSLLIKGRYIEHTPEGSVMREEGSVVSRPASALHRVEMLPGEEAVTLFFTGPKERDWGFMTENGWVHYKEFIEVHGKRSFTQGQANV